MQANSAPRIELSKMGLFFFLWEERPVDALHDMRQKKIAGMEVLRRVESPLASQASQLGVSNFLPRSGSKSSSQPATAPRIVSELHPVRKL